MAYPYLALRPTGNGLVSHYVVAGSRNPTTSVVWSVNDGLRKMWQDEYDKYSKMVQEEVKI